MKPQDFVNELYQKCVVEKIKEFEISYQRTATSKIQVFQGEISERSNNESQSVYLKVKKGKSIGGFACEELSANNISLMILQAVENASLIDDEDENFFYEGSNHYPEVVKYQPLNKIETLDKEQFILEVEKQVYAIDKRIKNVIALNMVTSESEVIVRNSLGLNLADSHCSASAGVYLSAEENGIVKTGSEYVLFDKEQDFNPSYLASKAVKEAVEKLGGVDLASGKNSIVFKNDAFSLLMSNICGIFSANQVQEKQSKLIGKLGKKIAAEIVTFVDNPLLSGGYETRKADGEGYPSQINVVVKNGILQTYLYNLRTAYKDGVKSTGNGGGGRGISFSNFYLEKGSLSEEELLNRVNTGVYVSDLSGLHAGYSPVSGDFSFGAQGFLIEEGKISKPLNQFTISGNIYALLEDIVLLGNNLKFSPSGFGAPSVVIENIMVSNK